MLSHIASAGSESMDWVSFGMSTQQEPLTAPVNPNRFEKLLGFARPPRVSDMENVLAPEFYVQHRTYIEDDLTDLMEEDVWGDNDDDTSSIDGDEHMMPSSKQWPDSESDSHFSALLNEGAHGSRVTGIFSPSQFSPAITSGWEAMRGQIFDSPHIMSYERGASGGSSGAPNIIGTSSRNGILLSNEIFSPDYGPRSAPVEVPIWSRLRAMMKNGGSFLGSDDDNDNDNVSVLRIPPHELIARQHARSQTSAFSVIEGTGRTLKGRDVSKVRDGVWKQTGFPG